MKPLNALGIFVVVLVVVSHSSTGRAQEARDAGAPAPPPVEPTDPTPPPSITPPPSERPDAAPVEPTDPAPHGGPPVGGTPSPQAPPVASAHAQTTGVSPASTAAPAADAGADAELAEAAGDETAIIQEDVQPTLTLLDTEALRVRLGGLLQVQAALYAGENALIENGDPASNAGFRIRRARIGVDARFAFDLGLFLTLDLLGTGPDGVISDAKLTWTPHTALRLEVGSGKVPFSYAALRSSRALDLIDRPLSVQTIAPDRRLGVTLGGSVWEDRIGYMVAVMNGTEGFRLGNRFGGIMFGGRLEVRPLGAFDVTDPDASGILVGGGILYDDGPATHTLAWSADATAAFFRARLSVEVLCDRIAPDDSPVTSPGVADSIDRCGGYVEATYALPLGIPVILSPAVRAELFDDDMALDDAGDVLLIGGGINALFIDPYIRAQLHYLARLERYGSAQRNDTLVLMLQGAF
jgi:hypothetical protein